MESGKAVDTGRLQNISVYWLAFVVYWVIILFGYDMPFFHKHFGLLDANGKPITSKTNTISSNVVSVLQAGAFFGTLVLFTLIFALGAALTTPVTPVFVPERSPKERLSPILSIGAYLNAKLAGSKPVRVWQIPFGFQLVMLLGLKCLQIGIPLASESGSHAA
ncbi:hypothetical protein B0H13DRAFT_2333113 [Mycena leptocephala]|nr:hypothetical protein B0H13DRAFT_2368098 [Mycena leptocephala]KAJ7906763.1 hypothetical protein B0H13DRAFT_2333113 [Mycena leptocephala]